MSEVPANRFPQSALKPRGRGHTGFVVAVLGDDLRPRRHRLFDKLAESILRFLQLPCAFHNVDVSDKSRLDSVS